MVSVSYVLYVSFCPSSVRQMLRVGAETNCVRRVAARKTVSFQSFIGNSARAPSRLEDGVFFGDVKDGKLLKRKVAEEIRNRPVL